MINFTFKAFLQKDSKTFFVSYETFVKVLDKSMLPYRVELKADYPDIEERLSKLDPSSSLYVDFIQVNKDKLMFEVSIDELLQAMSQSGTFQITVQHA